MVSPINSYTGLTRRDQFAEKGELEALYPTGVRNFARVFPIDDDVGRGAALFLKGLSAPRVAALSDRDGYSDLLVRAFRLAAGPIGLDFGRSFNLPPGGEGYFRAHRPPQARPCRWRLRRRLSRRQHRQAHQGAPHTARPPRANPDQRTASCRLPDWSRLSGRLRGRSTSRSVGGAGENRLSPPQAGAF